MLKVIASGRRSWAVAAVLLLLAVPALAQAPAAKPPSSGPDRPPVVMPRTPAPALADIPGPACTIRQIPVFNAAMVEARTRLGVAVRVVRDTPSHPGIRQWFGNAPHQVVLSALQRSAMRLANTAGFDIHCNDPDRCAPNIAAYVQAWSRTLRDAEGRPTATYRIDEGQVIGVCPPFFRARMDGTGTRWGYLVHEVTHVAAETRDHAYGRNASLALARENGMRAAENADNYRYFVETLPRP